MIVESDEMSGQNIISFWLTVVGSFARGRIAMNCGLPLAKFWLKSRCRSDRMRASLISLSVYQALSFCARVGSSTRRPKSFGRM